MNVEKRKKTNSFSLMTVMRARIAAFLYKAYGDSVSATRPAYSHDCRGQE